MTDRQSKDSAGFTLIELLIVVAVIGLLAAIAIPGLMRARMSANEMSAIGSLRAVNTAEAAYAATAGKAGYAIRLATLAISCGGGTQGFISPDLSVDPSGKSGYTITLDSETPPLPGPDDCNGTPTELGYYAAAVPMGLGRSGYRGFATDARGSIWQDMTGGAPTQPFTAGAYISIIK